MRIYVKRGLHCYCVLKHYYLLPQWQLYTLHSYSFLLSGRKKLEHLRVFGVWLYRTNEVQLQTQSMFFWFCILFLIFNIYLNILQKECCAFLWDQICIDIWFRMKSVSNINNLELLRCLEAFSLHCFKIWAT